MRILCVENHVIYVSLVWRRKPNMWNIIYVTSESVSTYQSEKNRHTNQSIQQINIGFSTYTDQYEPIITLLHSFLSNNFVYFVNALRPSIYYRWK